MNTPQLEEYLAKSRSLGISEEVANAELQAVCQEAQTSWATVDVYATAWRRPITPPTDRPTGQLREVARRMATTCGLSDHPDAIDEQALNLSRLLVDGAPRTLADEMANATAPDTWHP